MFVDGDDGIFDVTPSRGINEAPFLIRVKNSSKLDFETRSGRFASVACLKQHTTVERSSSFVQLSLAIFRNKFHADREGSGDGGTEAEQSAGGGVRKRPERQLSRVHGGHVRGIDSGELRGWDDSGVGSSPGRGQWQLWNSRDQIHEFRGQHRARVSTLPASFRKDRSFVYLTSCRLSMDPLTGVITVKETGSSFDRELVSRHYLTVEARDDLGKGNRNTVQLIVNVNDVNDNAPVFLQNKYEAVLLENEDHFESPLLVEAFDIDLNGSWLAFTVWRAKLNTRTDFFISIILSSVCT